MSAERIESLAAGYVAMHKHDLARALAKAVVMISDHGGDVSSLFADETEDTPEPAFAQGADAEVIEVAPASTEHQRLDGGGDQDASSIEASASTEVETKTYTDGTTATGTAPLPDKSPAQQDEPPAAAAAEPAPAPKAPSKSKKAQK